MDDKYVSDDSIIVSYGGTSTDIVIPTTIVEIGDGVFDYSRLNSVDFSQAINLKFIGNQAFRGNKNLKTIKKGTGNVFNWGDIINCKSRYIFEKGTVISNFGNVIIE